MCHVARAVTVLIVSKLYLPIERRASPVRGAKFSIMPAWEALKGLTAQLSSALNVEDIGRALLNVGKLYGWTNLIVVDVTKLFNRIGPALLYASESRELIEGFDAARPLIQRPAFLRAQSSDRPFLASEVRRATGQADDHGWFALPGGTQHKESLVVPVHVDGKLVWGAGFSGFEPDTSQPAQSVLSASAHEGYLRFRELLDSRQPHSPLSPRESECLKWVADGKTDFEVGKILSISPRTVRFHIRNAKTKLGVATRIQAVAKRAGGGVA
jgi:DNA-binding CsgD family transcriptional regulator